MTRHRKSLSHVKQRRADVDDAIDGKIWKQDTSASPSPQTTHTLPSQLERLTVMGSSTGSVSRRFIELATIANTQQRGDKSVDR